MTFLLLISLSHRYSFLREVLVRPIAGSRVSDEPLVRCVVFNGQVWDRQGLIQRCCQPSLPYH